MMPDTLNFYSEQLHHQCANFPGAQSPLVTDYRKQAMDYFIQSNWPTHKQAAFKHTSCKLLQQQTFPVQTTPALECVEQIGVQCQSLADALAAPDFAPYLTFLHPQETDSAFVLLNHALWQTGLVIRIPANAEPAFLRINCLSAPDAAHFVKLFFILEPGASAHIVFNHAQAIGFSNVMITSTLAPHASLNIVHECDSTNQSIHFVHHQIEQQAQSHFYDCALSLRAAWLRHEVLVHLREAKASCDCVGIYLGDHTQQIDHHLSITHAAPDCRSNQFYKGVLTDEAKGIFQGKVHVKQDAQKTHATQKNNTILLSKTAEIDTSPELEIYAHDITCSHGATVGALSYDILFYLMARGIDEQTAKKLLLASFVQEVLLSMPFLKEEARALVERRLTGF